MTDPSPHKDVRMRGFVSRMDVTEVCRLVRELARPLEAEAVRLAASAGRVVARDLTASVPVPRFPRSAMDGYAVRGEETFGASDYNPLTFHLIGEAMPGRPFAGTLQSGEAVRIMTGAPLPQGANAVVMAEVAREAEGAGCREVAIAEAVPPGAMSVRSARTSRPGSVCYQPDESSAPRTWGPWHPWASRQSR